MMRSGRILNPLTLMWEFSDKSGVAVPDELMPKSGTRGQIPALLEVKDRLAKSAGKASQSPQGEI